MPSHYNSLEEFLRKERNKVSGHAVTEEERDFLRARVNAATLGPAMKRQRIGEIKEEILRSPIQVPASARPSRQEFAQRVRQARRQLNPPKKAAKKQSRRDFQIQMLTELFTDDLIPGGATIEKDSNIVPFATIPTTVRKEAVVDPGAVGWDWEKLRIKKGDSAGVRRKKRAKQFILKRFISVGAQERGPAQALTPKEEQQLIRRQERLNIQMKEEEIRRQKEIRRQQAQELLRQQVRELGQ